MSSKKKKEKKKSNCCPSHVHVRPNFTNNQLLFVRQEVAETEAPVNEVRSDEEAWSVSQS